MKKALIVLLMALNISACGNMTKQDVGVLSGAAVGGLLGSRFGHGGGQAAAIVGGTMIGALIGGAIGRHMDKIDRMEMNQALEDNPDHRSKQWTNPNSGNRYAVEPTRTYYEEADDGYKQPCREYRTTAWIGGRKQQVYGTACRTADGDWRAVQ